jgi:hypothetical protein
VLHAAVSDEESATVAHLSVDDPRQIDAALADQPAAELDREFCVAQALAARRDGFPSAAPTASMSSG